MAAIILQFIAVLLLSSCYASAASLVKISQQDISTEYLPLTIVRYEYDFGSYGGGGSIAEDGDYIYYATSEGLFYRFDKKSLIVEKNIFPPIKLNAELIKQSQRITSYELPPRLHDIIFKNKSVYVTYDIYDPIADGVRFELARLDTDKSWVTIFSTPIIDISHYSMGGGGALADLDETHILFSVGDFGLSRKNGLNSDFAPQNTFLPWGKILKLDVSSNRAEVYSIGHKNPLGLTVIGSGKVIETEHGPRGGDEINIIHHNANYGWPYTSFGTHYGGYQRIESEVTKSGCGSTCDFEEPFYSFIPSVAPSSIIAIKKFDNAWHGFLLIGSLKAASIFVLRPDDQLTKILSSEPIFIGIRSRHLIESEGAIWALDDSGQISSIQKSVFSNLENENLARLRESIGKCTVCHSLDRNEGLNYAPNLSKIIGKKIGSQNFSFYSSALKSFSENNLYWDEKNLKAFIMNPHGFAFGTTMPNLNLTDTDAQHIVEAIKILTK